MITASKNPQSLAKWTHKLKYIEFNVIIPIIAEDRKCLENTGKATIVLSRVDKCILRKSDKCILRKSVRKRGLLGWIPKELLK